jgi:hypothetical protein
MSDAANCSERDEQEQQVELLPARTVLSMFTQGLDGTPGIGTIGGSILGIPFGDNSGNGIGGAGGSANGSS